MDGRAIGLFIHIAGALGVFAALGLEWTGLGQIRRATHPEWVRAWMGIFRNARRVESVSMLAVVLTGIYPMVTEWGALPWIIVSLGSFALMFALSVVLSRPQMARIEQVLATDNGPASPAFNTLASHPLLWISIRTRVAIGAGVLLLMLAKPDYAGSLLIIGIAIVLGVASAFTALRTERAPAQPVRMIIALVVIIFIAALALLAANVIFAGTIPPAATTSSAQDVQTRPAGVQTETAPSSLPTLAPTPWSTLGPTSSPKAASPDGPSVLQDRCTQCHSLAPIQRVKKTRAEWAKTLSRMESLGAKMSDAEKTILLDYLSAAEKP